MRGKISILALALALTAPSVAFAQDGEGDPWEGFNRDMYAVHDSVDRAVLEPVARGYRAVTPSPVRQGVLNFLRNLRGPVIFANDLLQGEVGRGGVTAARFAVNTTVGIAGLFDPASGMGLERHDEDFGQTLAVWGVDEGPYIFVPLMGPSNLRDTTGRVVDTVFDPFTWMRGDDVDAYRAGRTALAALSAREQVIEAVDDLQNSVDPYTSIRSSYNLLRESAIQNGRSDVQDLPDSDDIPESTDPVEPENGENPQQVGAIESDYAALILAKRQPAPTSGDKLEGETK
jgi:phospholipid-binding lipoprotein MlaA